MSQIKRKFLKWNQSKSPESGFIKFNKEADRLPQSFGYAITLPVPKLIALRSPRLSV
jgi:hypothetical protein